MKSNPATLSFYTRFEAAVILNNLYLEFLKDNKLTDTERPDWSSILVENSRNPVSPSAILKGYPRGNQHAYTRLEFIRISGRPFYVKANIIKWFKRHFEYRILDRAA